MKKLLQLLLSVLLVLTLTSCQKQGNKSDDNNALFKAGTYTGVAEGRNGEVKVEVTVTDSEIKEVKVVENKETEEFAKEPLETIPKAIVENQSLAVDMVSGSTFTSKAILEASEAALKEAGADVEKLKAKEATEKVELSFEPGTYTGVAKGYNGDVQLDVTFDEKSVKDIVVKESKETPHVGDVAFDILFEDIKAANGSGVDVVSGATFTSLAIKNALADAANQAKVNDIETFKKNTVKHEPQDPMTLDFDVVVIGAGGAGMSAAVQAAQEGYTVLVIEKNAEIGGNTLVSGGQYQSVQKYLVWDPQNPEATTGEYEGKTYDKVKSDFGRIHTLETIYNWSEKEFDGTIDKDHQFVAGDIEELSKRGVHPEYLKTLQDLKAEIKAYLDWAKPQLEAGKKENELTLFSTINLHVFQTYYGGIRPNQDNTKWIYGDFGLVNQFVVAGQEVKPWLEAMGVQFDNALQPTLVGALWQRENVLPGAVIDGKEYPRNWGAYFMAPKTELLKLNEKNQILLRTSAESLIEKDGRIVGVKAKMYDGTEVTANASKGVVIATGGYAANIEMVVETNDYWSSDKITKDTKTTNRNSLMGDGIRMAQEVGASVTGMEFTQLMPISWIQDGNLAFGGGESAIYLNPTTGKRYVDESGERDVLSKAGLENGIEVDGVKGVFIELSHYDTPIPGPYPYGDEDVEWRQYVRNIDGVVEVLNKLGIELTKEQIVDEITKYDNYVMGVSDQLEVPKAGYRDLIGQAEKDENGKWKPETYEIGQLRLRFLAPSTHHTMGGISTDLDRRVLNEKGEPIPGLYAAGEVTGGIHGGNRLGGNAIVEIIVSGRTAAQAIKADNK